MLLRQPSATHQTTATNKFKAQAEITLAVCFLLASDVTRNIAASLAFQFFSLSA